MNEQSTSSDAGRRLLKVRRLDSFHKIWASLSEFELAEYRRLRRKVYAFLPAYYVAAGNLQRLENDASDTFLSTGYNLTEIRLENWSWREQQMRARLISYGMTGGLLDEAWDFHQREIRAELLYPTFDEWTELDLKMEIALLNAVKPSSMELLRPDWVAGDDTYTGDNTDRRYPPL